MGSRYESLTTPLLDSHCLIWWQAGGNRLSRVAARIIGEAERILVSPISCWELATLHRLGRIVLDRDPVIWIRDLLDAERIVVAPVSPEAAAWAGRLGADFPGDPADRLLYATARELRVPFVSKDERLREYARATGDVAVVW